MDGEEREKMNGVEGGEAIEKKRRWGDERERRKNKETREREVIRRREIKKKE